MGWWRVCTTFLNPGSPGGGTWHRQEGGNGKEEEGKGNNGKNKQRTAPRPLSCWRRYNWEP